MTQMEYARRGHITPEMQYVAEVEEVSVEFVLKQVAEGYAVIPKNKLHKNNKGVAIGKGFRVKVNANIGTSMGYSSAEEEYEKAQVALKAGADAVMVLSTWGDLRGMRRRIVDMVDVPVGSVPIYDAAVMSYKSGKAVVDFSVSDFIEMVRIHAEDGIDFMTIHAGLTMDIVKRLRHTNRALKMVSRGGAIIGGWMLKNGRENPFYEYFDDILDIAREYDITLSLGDSMRPGAVVDATDDLQISELIVLGELVQRARAKGVQVMVEGPGHVPLDEIEANVKVAKSITKDAPFFVLGPLSIDSAPGYDHIVAAVGGAIAAYHGTDFLCYVTPAEHVSLPDKDDVYEGVVAAKIAARIADMAKRREDALQREYEMAYARKTFDWDTMFALAIDSEKPRRYREKRPFSGEGCSMCGPFCAIKIIEEYASGEVKVL